MNRKCRHRTSSRLRGYDYAQSGRYFVTFCIKGKHCLLGKIQNGEMILSSYGEIVKIEIERTATVRPNVTIDRYVIMPNHVHMALKILGAYGVLPQAQLTDDALTLSSIKENPDPIWRSPSQTIGAIVRGIKSAVSGKIGFSPFQINYYDNIVRNESMYQTICHYIDANPVRWNLDRFFIEAPDVNNE